jgi:hypothetical protein
MAQRCSAGSGPAGTVAFGKQPQDARKHARECQWLPTSKALLLGRAMQSSQSSSLPAACKTAKYTATVIGCPSSDVRVTAPKSWPHLSQKRFSFSGMPPPFQYSFFQTLIAASCVTAEDRRSEATRALNVRIEYRHSIRSAMTVSARADTAPPLLRTGHPPYLKRGGSVQWLPIFPVQCLSGGSDKGE